MDQTLLVPVLETEEDIKFGSRPPLFTILVLSFGPMFLNMLNSLHDLVDLTLTSHGLSVDRCSIISLTSLLRSLIYSFSFVTQGGCTIKISQIIAQNKTEEASQLFVDYIRLCIITALIIPVVLIPPLKIILQWIGIENRLINESFWYLIPIIFSSFFVGLFNLNQMTLIGLAKSNLATVLQFVCFGISIGFDCICIFVFKSPAWAQGLSFFSGQIIISILLTILFFNGKFSIKPISKMLMKRFCSEFWPALKLSIPHLSLLLFGSFPNLSLIACVNKTAQKIEHGNRLPSLVSAALKPGLLLTAMLNGSNFGLQSAGSWAIAKRLNNRFLKLIFSSLLLPIIIYGVIVPIMIFRPQLILQIFIDVKYYESEIKPIVPNIYLIWIAEPITEVLCTLLLVLKHSLLATIPIIIGFLGLGCTPLITSSIWKDRPDYAVLGVPVNNAMKLVSAVLLSIIPLMNLGASKINHKNVQEVDFSDSMVTIT